MPPLLTIDGRKIRNLREEAGLTIGELVEALERETKVKCSYHTIMRAENGKQNPKPRVIKALAEYFGVPRSALLDRESMELVAELTAPLPAAATTAPPESR